MPEPKPIIIKLIERYEELNSHRIDSDGLRYDKLSEGFVTIDQVLIDLKKLLQRIQ